jgi:hypothetical protein
MKPAVFAHYYTWFGSKAVSGLWTGWPWKDAEVEHDPDRILDGERRDIAAVEYPRIGAYDSSNPEVLRYHCRLAQAALLDAFTVDWYGPEDEPSLSPTGREIIRDPAVDRNFKILLKVAEETGFPVSICYEEKILTHARVLPDESEAVRIGRRHFEYIAERYFASPGYWKIEGRPVLVLWGNHSLSARGWGEILAAVRKWNPFVFFSYHWPQQPTLLESKGLIDAFYPWMNIKDLEGQTADLDEFYRFAGRSLKEGRNRTLCGGVWPSFNDTGVRGWGGGSRVIPDPRDELYALTWDACLRARPDLVSLATWNDWNEGSVIEPSRERGFRRLEQTRAYIQKIKGFPASFFDFSALPQPLS